MKEMKKLEILIERKNILQRQTGLECEELIFVACEIDDSIIEKALRFMRKNNIRYISKPDE